MLFRVKVLGVECRLQADLVGIYILHAEPLLPDLSVELAGQLQREIRIDLRFRLCERILRMLGRRHDEVPVADRDVLLEEIDPSVILVRGKMIS